MGPAAVLLVGVAVASAVAVEPLRDARRRASSVARHKFAEKVRQCCTPETTSHGGGGTPTTSIAAATEVLTYIAAEEQPLMQPEVIALDVDEELETLAERVRQRLRLDALFETDEDPSLSTARATSAVLFGVQAPDEAVGEAFFRPQSPNFYDPDHSFLPRVLERRAGIPLTLSLVLCDVARRADDRCDLVGLNAPGHQKLVLEVLVAPRDPAADYAIDAYDSGRVLRAGALKAFVARRARLETHAAASRLVEALRREPMSPAAWARRCLANLHRIYTESNDVVRALGVAERLLVIADVATDGVIITPAEADSARFTVAKSLVRLRDDARRDEALALLETLKQRRSSDAWALGLLSPDDVDALLNDAWLTSPR